MLKVTEHGRQRIRQRCGVNAKAAKRLAKIAFDKGLTQSDTTGILRKYMGTLRNFNGSANNIRLYGDKTYIFCDEYLVTVMSTPKEYLSIVNRIMAKRRASGD